MSAGQQQEQAISYIEQQDIARVFSLGEEGFVMITRLNPPEGHDRSVGNVLRRTCTLYEAELGHEACKAACQYRSHAAEMPRDPDKLCADLNLRTALETSGVTPADVLMVGVGANNVGFADELDDKTAPRNPEGWREISGYNAFFARAEEISAAGTRLGDCAFLAYEFTDRDGKRVYGFEHGTKINLRGESAYDFPGEHGPVSYTQHVAERAIQHYGADAASFSLRLVSSIRPENYLYNFDSPESMEKQFPGLFAAGFIHHVEGPLWQSSNAVSKSWQIDFRGVMLHDIQEMMTALGMKPEQFTDEGMIDAADTGGVHSSHVSKEKLGGDPRDLYLVGDTSAI